VLIHDPSWQNFVKHYWLSFVWIAAAVITVMVFVIGGEQALSSPMVFFPSITCHTQHVIRDMFYVTYSTLLFNLLIQAWYCSHEKINPKIPDVR